MQQDPFSDCLLCRSDEESFSFWQMLPRSCSSIVWKMAAGHDCHNRVPSERRRRALAILADAAKKLQQHCLEAGGMP